MEQPRRKSKQRINRKKAQILLSLQDNYIGTGSAAALRNQASALQQYVGLSTEVDSSQGTRLVHKSKEVKESLNTKSKLSEYIKSNRNNSNNNSNNNNNNNNRLRVFTVQDRMNIAEKQHHKRLYDWTKLNQRGRRRQRHNENNENNSTEDYEPEPEVKHKQATENQSATATPEQHDSIHRLKHLFDCIDQGKPVRPHKLKVLHNKKAMASHIIPEPPPQRTMAIDPKLLGKRIKKFDPISGHTVSSVPTPPQNSPHPLHLLQPPHSTYQHHHRHQHRIRDNNNNNNNNKTSFITQQLSPEQKATDIIMKNMINYLRIIPKPHLFDPKNIIESEEEEVVEVKKSGIGNIAGVASLVGRFRRKLRKKQLIARYSTSKELSNSEYQELQKRTKIFFNAQGDQATINRLISELIMKWIELDKPGLSAVVIDGLQRLIDRQDRTTFYLLHIHMNNFKFLKRYMKTVKRLENERKLKKIQEDKVKEKLKVKVPLSMEYVSAIDRLLQ